MSVLLELGGLCKYCEHRDSCSYVASAGARLSYECDEFVSTGAATGMEAPAQLADYGEEPKVRKNKGLCTDCRNAASCMLPAHPGAIWHCQEYL